MRSRSGVLVVTIVLKPDKFSCPKKCSYCPTETNLDGVPTQPKSYLSSEPAMLRALQYNFDVKGQLHDRIRSYMKTGNISTNQNADNHSYKLEVIVSGGTWESYNYEYRHQVMNEIYYAANTFDQERPIYDVENMEIKMNETAKYRVIGLTIETRPDFITNKSLKDYRKWGITRVQIGVQHYDDGILNKIKRDCFTKDTIKAIRLLKNCGFKFILFNSLNIKFS
jgi:histone acetyltransferase (RNA polymerase elongator complex component)